MEIFLLETNPNNQLTTNMDCMAIICSFLNRKKKFEMREVSKDFLERLFPRIMVSFNFYLTRTLNNNYSDLVLSKLLCVDRLGLEEFYVTN